MACDLPQRDWGAGITPWRVGALVVGVAAGVGAIVLDADQLASQVAGFLYGVAWFLLAMGFGIPVATAAEIGDPRLGKLLTVLRDRQKQLTEQIETRLQATLTNVVGDVTLDDTRTGRLVAQAVERAAGRWRGSVSLDLDTYLLCCAVRLAVRDTWEDPKLGPGDPRALLLPLSRRVRAICALRRCDVPDADIAYMLDCSVGEVADAACPGAGDQR
jgi:hypothetical protein